MARLFLKFFFRNLTKNFRLQSVNILSFAMSIYLCLVVFVYVKREYNYNSNFHESEQIYRLTTQVSSSNYEEKLGLSPEFIGPYVVNLLPEIEQYTNINGNQNVKVKIPGENKFITADKVFKTDTNFFKIFRLHDLSGRDVKNSKIKDAYITPEFSKNLFGKENPIGKEISITGEQYLIKDIVKPLKNSDLNFNILLIDYLETDWLTTFIKLAETPNESSKTIAELKINTTLLEELQGQYNEQAFKLAFGLESMNDLHFTDALYNNFKASDKTMVMVLLAAASLLMLCAMFNAVNLIVAGSMGRVKEFVLKRIYGAGNTTILLQISSEIIMTITISTLIAVAVLLMTHVEVMNFLGYFHEGNPFNFGFFLAVILLIIVSVIISTSLCYFFFYGSIKGSLIEKNIYSKNQKFSSLVVLQIVICFSLLCISYFVDNQLQMIRDQSMPNRYEKTIVMGFSDSDSYNRILNFKKRILQIASVKAASLCNENAILGNQLDLDLFKLNKAPESQAFLAKKLIVDKDYFTSMNIPLIEKGFNEYNWHNKFVLSTSASQIVKDSSLNLGEDRVNNRIVAGISKNFAWNLYKGVEPLVFYMDTAQFNSLLIHFKTKISAGDIDLIEKEWTNFFPYSPFTFTYLSEHNAQMYRNDFLIGDFLDYLSLLVYGISLVGILSITTLSIFRRFKEFSIRRIFGATELNLTFILIKYLSKIFILSFILSIPLIYLSMDKWLSRFKERIEVNFFQVFLIFLAFVILSTLFNMLFVRKALKAEPSKLLRKTE